MTTRPRRQTLAQKQAEDRTRIRRLEALWEPDAFIEFIDLSQPIVALEQDGTSVSGTTTAGEPVFDTNGSQQTNIGGVYAVNTPPITLTGKALSFDSDASGVNPPSRFISLNERGWYYVQRRWIISEALGIPPCWFDMSGDANALGDGGGHAEWVRGTFNENASMRGHLMYLPATTSFPYLINTGLSHECDVHDGTFEISVAFVGQTDDD